MDAMIMLTTQVRNQTRSKIAARIFNSEAKSENNDQFDVVHLYNWQCKHAIFRDINKGVSECEINYQLCVNVCREVMKCAKYHTTQKTHSR